jgi:hypothetical protein
VKTSSAVFIDPERAKRNGMRTTRPAIVRLA